MTDDEFQKSRERLRREEELTRKARNETVFLSQLQMNDFDVETRFHSSRACAADRYENSVEMTLYDVVRYEYEVCRSCRHGFDTDIAALEDAISIL